MDADRNPYTPGAGKTPPALVGREAELEAGRVVVARVARGLGADAPILYGLRGVGKTVLLKALHDQADAAGWLTVELEGKQDEGDREATRRRFARALALAARTTVSRRKRVSASWKRALATIGSFTLAAGGTITFEVQPSKGRADSGDAAVDLEELVQDLVPALRESGTGFGVFVDEMQDLDPTTLSALISVQHRAHQNDWPFHVFGAGLPNVPGRLADIRSYSERFRFMEVGALNDADARAALTEPAREVGVTFEDAALDRLAAASGGYPYFVQVFGDQAWRASPAGDRVSEADAVVAVEQGTAVLDDSLFQSRWNRATPAQRKLLTAMSVDPAESQIADLVTRLRKRRPGDLSVARDELIKKGLIFAPERGVLRFTVPHMNDYIRRRTVEV